MVVNRRGFARQAPKRKLVWSRARFDVLSLTGPSGISLNDCAAGWALVSGTSQLPVGSTVTRVRMDVSVVRSVGAGTRPSVTGGLIVGPTSLDAADVGPADLQHLDWMWWRELFLSEGNNSTTGPTSFEIDVQSQRRLQELQSTLWLVFQGNGSDTYDLKCAVSALLKLP